MYISYTLAISYNILCLWEICSIMLCCVWKPILSNITAQSVRQSSVVQVDIASSEAMASSLSGS